MTPLVRRVFLGILPKMLRMRRVKYMLPDYDDNITVMSPLPQILNQSSRGQGDQEESNTSSSSDGGSGSGSNSNNGDFKETQNDPSSVLRNAPSKSDFKAQSSCKFLSKKSGNKTLKKN